MPIYMKCARNFTLRSLSGHIIHFKADTPCPVPDSCVDEALAVNIIPCDGGYAPEGVEVLPKTLRITAMSGELREALLLHAIDEIYREASPKDFDGGARPKTHAISERAGVEITAIERTKLWDKYRDLKGSNSDLPRPRNFDMVVDVQRITSKTELLSFGETLGMDTALLKGSTLKEVKSAVIAAAVQYKPLVFTDSKLDEA